MAPKKLKETEESLSSVGISLGRRMSRKMIILIIYGFIPAQSKGIPPLPQHPTNDWWHFFPGPETVHRTLGGFLTTAESRWNGIEGRPPPQQSQPKILYPAKLSFMDEKDILRHRGASNMPTIVGLLKRYTANGSPSGRKEMMGCRTSGRGKSWKINIWAHIISFSLVYKHLFDWKQKFHSKWLLMPITVT